MEGVVVGGKTRLVGTEIDLKKSNSRTDHDVPQAKANETTAKAYRRPSAAAMGGEIVCIARDIY